jgi:UDP-3-O-[3-hydroxymyristoyl] glucosamine N-acyltransferase
LLKLKDIATLVDGELIGDPELEIQRVAGIEEAGEGDITFLSNVRYQPLLASTRASAVIVSPQVEVPGKSLVRVKNPYLAFARILGEFAPETVLPSGVHEKAHLGVDVSLGESVTLLPYCFIGNQVIIGDRVAVYPGVYVGDKSVIGDDTILYPNVTLYPGTEVGKRVIIHSGTVVGSDGFGFVQQDGKNIKIPQIGTVVIEDDVEIGSNVSIDRATMGRTVIKKGTKIDNLVQIAHNVEIGQHSVVVSQVGISGSTRVGENVILGGQAGLVGHIEIGDRAKVAAKTGVSKSVPPDTILAGHAGVPIKEWKRSIAAMRRLPETVKKIQKLEKKLAELEQKLVQKEGA